MTVQASASPRRRATSRRRDHYVFALPIEQMGTFVTKDVRAEAPAWGVLPDLAKSVDWMTGVMFYLKNDANLPTGHDDYLDSDWALTSIFQNQGLWPRFAAYAGRGAPGPPDSFGLHLGLDGATHAREGQRTGGRGVLTKRRAGGDLGTGQGSVGRPPGVRDRRQRARVLLPRRGHPGRAQAGDLPAFDGGQAIAAAPGAAANAEPLLVNQAGTRRLRPNASGDLHNAHLASDYVRTTTDLATMEGANEAARRAVNGILRQEGRTDTCKLFPMREPLGVLRAFDRVFFKRGKPWPRALAAGEPVIRAGMIGLVKVTEVANAAVKLVRDAATALPVVGSFIGKGAR